MHSYLIHSATPAERKRFIIKQINRKTGLELPPEISPENLKYPDILVLEPQPAIGIDAIRKLKNYLLLQPHSLRCKSVVILAADKMTPEAQNALLKTLEEPAADTFIFLEVSNPDLLLQTTISRCQLKMVKTKTSAEIPDQAVIADVRKILTSSPGKRITYLDPVSNKEEAKTLLEKIINSFTHIHRRHPSTAGITKGAIQALHNLENNCNYKLVMEHFLLELKLGR